MHRIHLGSLVAFLLSYGVPAAIPPVQAIPGQPTNQVAAWMRSNPTLRPLPGEKLTIRRNNTPSQRLVFEASLFAPGRIVRSNTGGKVRSETLQLFDMLYGVTQARLEESLRAIYGLEIAQDYANASLVYRYPSPRTEAEAQQNKQPIAAALTGELRRGNRFAYWVEVARNPQGLNYAGKIVVFLNEDLAKVETEIRNR
ncbi:MAG: hypothetical protein VKJ24_19175 [Synechococcales bacterium]|nr:hypothetical protein [Synechococcales bacterium]